MANPISAHDAVRAARPGRRRPLEVVEGRTENASFRSPRPQGGASGARAARRQLILDTLVAIARSGQAVTAARICAGGDVLLLTGNQTPALGRPSEDEDWVAFAGQA